MSSTKRTITIDKANLQGIKNKNTKSKSNASASTIKVKPNVKTNQFIQPNTLKRKLLARIKNHQQQKKYKNESQTIVPETTVKHASEPTVSSNSESNESFVKSLEYLNALASNQRHKQKNKTQKRSMPAATATVVPQLQVPATPNPTPPSTSSTPNTPNPILTSLPMQPMQMMPASSPGPNTVPPQVFLNTFPNASESQQIQPVHESVMFPPSIAPPPVFQAEVLHTIAPVQLNTEPQWGCLKGGAKPTFRMFHNKTCKTNTNQPQLEPQPHLQIDEFDEFKQPVNDESEVSNKVLETKIDMDIDKESEPVTDAVAASEVLYGSRQQRLDEYRKEQLKLDKQHVEPTVNIKQTKQRIITKKYKLGKYVNKNGPVIGVLIKNVQTQRNVEKRRKEMRHIPLDTIIARLHKKMLLKVGSTAPPDILREMYESAVMAGDIENEGNDIALHNFLAGGSDSNDDQDK
jgi:hypothetical protein